MIFTDGPVVPGSPIPVFGGPFEGFTAPSDGGESDKEKLIETHLKVFKEQVTAAQGKCPIRLISYKLYDIFNT